MASGKFVAYYRVSTERQGRSGLGLDAQKRAVADFLNGGRWELVAEFTEVESGRRADRVALQHALAACRLHGATLVVAKLDRLSRNAAFLLTLRDSGARFVAADMPDANHLTVGILALVAQHEAEAISARTKAALAAAKARGTPLGAHNPKCRPLDGAARASGTAESAATRRVIAEQRARDLAPTVAELRAAGAKSLRALARGLNERRIPAPRQGLWTAAQVSRVLCRTGTLAR